MPHRRTGLCSRAGGGDLVAKLLKWRGLEGDFFYINKLFYKVHCIQVQVSTLSDCKYYDCGLNPLRN